MLELEDEDVQLSMSPESSSFGGLNGLFARPPSECCLHCAARNTHAQTILQGLNEQRRDGLLCDVTIVVGEQRMPCHRSVLAACSPYFAAMFTGEMREKGETEVRIEAVDAAVMAQLIDFAYTSDIDINQDNAQGLLSASNMVQMLAIKEECCIFLQREMDASNCIGIHCFSETHVCEDLAKKAKKFILKNFSEVATHEEILMLSMEKLIEFISDDDVHVPKEEIILQAVLSWVKYDASRTADFAKVLSHVRLPSVSPYALCDLIDTEPLLSSDPRCRRLVDEAVRFHAMVDRQSELLSPWQQPRSCLASDALLVVIGGEIYNKHYLKYCDAFSLKTAGWRKLRELSCPRLHHGTAVSEGRRFVYVTGGFSKTKVVLNSVLRYEVLTDRWCSVASMGTARARHGMASLDGALYVVAGYGGSGGRLDSVERYCPAGAGAWSYVAPIGTAFSRCQAAAAGGHLYVAGGSTEPNNQVVATFMRYSPVTDQWQTLTSMPAPRCLSGLIPLQGLLYAVGGTEEMVTASRKLTCYDPAADSWSHLPDMIEPRFDAGVSGFGNKIYVLSGHDGENAFYKTIEEYDTDTQTWSILRTTQMPYGRCRFGCVMISRSSSSEVT